MLLVGTCVVVGLIIVFMAFGVSKDQVSMREVIESNTGDVVKEEK
jgi:hypothetical protein